MCWAQDGTVVPARAFGFGMAGAMPMCQVDETFGPLATPTPRGATISRVFGHESIHECKS